MSKLLDLSWMSLLQGTSILSYTSVQGHTRPIRLTSICDTCANHVLVKYDDYFYIIYTCTFTISQTMEEISTTD